MKGPAETPALFVVPGGGPNSMAAPARGRLHLLWSGLNYWAILALANWPQNACGQGQPTGYFAKGPIRNAPVTALG